MRVGQDFILFTKKGGRLTCVFLSRTFHEEEKIDEVIIPMPSFDLSHRPLAGSSDRRHQIEMDLILKYSPFRTEAELFAQFDRISGENGTLVIIYNLKLLDTGEPEFDFGADPTDIRIADPEKQEQE